MSTASPAEANGFIILNGGILTGCSPYGLRQVLQADGLFQPPDPHQPVLRYSVTLPFVLSTVPLQMWSRSLSTLAMPLTMLSESPATTYDELPLAAARPDHGHQSSSIEVDVYVATAPDDAQFWKGGSSAKKGCGFWFLLPCRVAAVLDCLGHQFQRPVLGWEVAYRDGCSSSAVAVKTLVEPIPRQLDVVPIVAVPGLYVVYDFITAAEEAQLLEEVSRNRSGLKVEFLSKRRVAHFNRRFLYGVNRLTATGVDVNEEPSFYQWMRRRLQNADTAHVRLSGDYPVSPDAELCDQLTINYYDYSQMGACGIAAHVDAHSAFDDCIFLVSLGSYTVMEFARWDEPAEKQAPQGIYLAPRSLVVVSGEARYGWTHCIAEKKTDVVSELLPTCERGDRVSLTWRRGRTTAHHRSSCPCPSLCDGE